MSARLRALLGTAALAFCFVLSVCCKRSPPSATKDPTEPVPAHRVVSISASTTEALFAIGAGPLVVGRSRYCDYPPEALSLPAVGGFVDPNLEAVLGLRPDLVVGARGPLGKGFAQTLDERGIATFFPETERIEQIFTMLQGLGARTGHQADAQRLIEAMRARRDAITRAVATRPRPRVLLLFAHKPISAAGPASFPDEMITLGGGDNALHQGTAYPTLSLETVIGLDPDLIIDAEMGAGRADLDSTWSPVRAVREKKVIRIDDETVLRPGPRVMEGVARLARTIHPEVVIP